MHLGQHGAGRGALALERLDPAQPPKHCACLVHATNVAVTFARVCVRIVSKGIRFVPAVALYPDRELGEARAAIDRGESQAALKRLDKARRGYVQRRDQEGLDHVLGMAALVEAPDERSRIGRENLAYAVKQNLRHESRRAAQEREQAWVDPYPDLKAPTEHTGLVLTRPVKVAIGVGVVISIAILALVFVVPFFVDSGSTKTVTLRLLNDTQQKVTVRGCDDSDCFTTWLHRDVEPGLETDAEVDPDELVTLFRLNRPGPDTCLPVRVHDGYQQLGGGEGALAVRLSRATPCPGTTVLPRPAAQTF